jgi:transmembrane sensor
MDSKKISATLKPEKAHEIDSAAARWAARLDRGLSPDEEHDLQVWLLGDTRRLGAFAKARAVLARTERAIALGAWL